MNLIKAPIAHLWPVYGEDELVLHRLPDKAEEHEGQGNVPGMEGRVGHQLVEGHVTPAPQRGQVLQDHRLPVGVVRYTTCKITQLLNNIDDKN